MFLANLKEKNTQKFKKKIIYFTLLHYSFKKHANLDSSNKTRQTPKYGILANVFFMMIILVENIIYKPAQPTRTDEKYWFRLTPIERRINGKNGLLQG